MDDQKNNSCGEDLWIKVKQEAKMQMENEVPNSDIDKLLKKEPNSVPGALLHNNILHTGAVESGYSETKPDTAASSGFESSFLGRSEIADNSEITQGMQINMKHEYEHGELLINEGEAMVQSDQQKAGHTMFIKQESPGESNQLLTQPDDTTSHRLFTSTPAHGHMHNPRNTHTENQDSACLNNGTGNNALFSKREVSFSVKQEGTADLAQYNKPTAAQCDDKSSSQEMSSSSLYHVHVQSLPPEQEGLTSEDSIATDTIHEDEHDEGTDLFRQDQTQVAKPSAVYTDTDVPEHSAHVDNTLSSSEFRAKRFECHLCDKSYTAKCGLTMHLRTHTGEKPFQCPICDKAFTYSSSLKTHKRTHSLEKPFTCHLCGKEFGYASSLQIHIRTHTNEKPHSCPVCSKAFVGSGDLKKHLRTHTGERPYSCEKCGRAFGRAYHLRTHMKVHQEEKPFICNVCDKAFVDEERLQSHSRVHSGERPFQCQQCMKTFTSSGALRRHILTHTGEKTCSCQYCGKSFLDTGGLQLHLRCHTGERPYNCDLCDKAFTTSGKLQRHKRIHTGEKPYVCPTCGAAFAQSGNLQAHMNTHSGEARFPCTQCDKVFRQASSLKGHMRQHSGERPYVCGLCGDSFARAMQLRIHVLAHSGAKPYNCDICGKGYTRSHKLLVHRRSHASAGKAPKIKGLTINSDTPTEKCAQSNDTGQPEPSS